MQIVSAAVFGKINVDYVPLTPQTAFVSLQARQVDILAAGATWTFLRDTSLGLNYTGVSYFAGQGFMVRRDMDISTVSDLSGATICITQGTTNEQNVADYFSVHGIEFNSLTFRDMELALAAYDDERCDAVTNERLSLAGRMKTLRKPSEHLILTESISKEPVGALVRHGDDRWLDIVFWAFNVRSAAEELGINQANVAQQRRDSRSPEVRRLLGLDGEFGRNLGVTKRLVLPNHSPSRQLCGYLEPQLRAAGRGTRLKRTVVQWRTTLRTTLPVTGPCSIWSTG